MQVYRDLFFNNVSRLLAGNFPVIRRIRGEAWPAMVRAFYRDHGCRTPLFPELPREFLRWVEGSEGHEPWLAELAHYEWAEADLQSSDAPMPPHDPAGDLLDGVPLLSPLAWPLAYRWPVDRIGPGHQPTDPPAAPTLVLLRRAASGEVRFSTLSPLLYQLLASIAANQDLGGRALLRSLAAGIGHADAEAFIDEARPMLARLREEGVVPGTRID